jgi:hypothetical protein
LELESLVSEVTGDATGSTYSSSKTSSLESEGMGILVYRLLAKPVRRDTRKGTVTYNRAVGVCQYLKVFMYTIAGVEVPFLDP